MPERDGGLTPPAFHHVTCSREGAGDAVDQRRSEAQAAGPVAARSSSATSDPRSTTTQREAGPREMLMKDLPLGTRSMPTAGRRSHEEGGSGQPASPGGEGDPPPPPKYVHRSVHPSKHQHCALLLPVVSALASAAARPLPPAPLQHNFASRFDSSRLAGMAHHTVARACKSGELSHHKLYVN